MRTYSQRMAAAILVMVSGLAVALALPTTALAEDGLRAQCEIDTTARSAADVAARWNALQPTYASVPYSVAPSTVAPYAAGSLHYYFLKDGLKGLNLVRYLGGVPDDVSGDGTLNDYAQHGAVLVAASTFSHTPPKPADMDQPFYDKGYTATSRGNIAWGYTSLWAFNWGSALDADASNISALGHRRWILSPQMAKTGLGYAEQNSVAYVFDKSRSYTFDYDALKWPCAGYFPVEAMQTSTPWSIQLNPDRYTWTSAPHTVTLRRASDGRTWTFDAADTNPAGEYFSFDTGGYGIPNCFVFRPDSASLGGYQPGDVYEVTLSGGIFACDGVTPATVHYTVEFFSVGAPPAGAPGDPATPECTPVYRFYNVKTGVHFYTASYDEKMDIIRRLGYLYKYEGQGYAINTTSASNGTPLYRLYNKKTGVHFYTADHAEKLDILKRFPDVYVYEGVAYNVSGSGTPGGTTIYRFFNVKTGVHFYTADPAERDKVIAELSHIYRYEGEAYYLAP